MSDDRDELEPEPVMARDLRRCELCRWWSGQADGLGRCSKRYRALDGRRYALLTMAQDGAGCGEFDRAPEQRPVGDRASVRHRTRVNLERGIDREKVDLPELRPIDPDRRELLKLFRAIRAREEDA